MNDNTFTRFYDNGSPTSWDSAFPFTMAMDCALSAPAVMTTADLTRSSLKFSTSVLPYSANGGQATGHAELSLSNQLMTTKARGGCGFTYFVSVSSNYDKNWDDTNAIMGQHLLSVSFVDEDEDFNGQCLGSNAVADGSRKVLPNRRIASNNVDLTIEMCLEACKYEKYAALALGQDCFCGDEFEKVSVLDQTSCNIKCSGNNSQECGASTADKWNVHSIASPQKFTGQCITTYTESDGGPTIVLHSGSAAMTLEICLEQCKYFKYATLGNGENCVCAENLPKNEFLPESECNTPCTGDSTNNKCGGFFKWSLYSIDNRVPFTGQCIQDYSDADGGPVLTVGTSFTGLTIEMCLYQCRHYKYAAVQNGNSCQCANEFTRLTAILADSECNMPCDGDSTQTCGGSLKSNVYTV